MRRQITFACGDYDRTRPLVDGTIMPEGIEFNWLTLPHHEIWTRMLLNLADSGIPYSMNMIAVTKI